MGGLLRDCPCNALCKERSITCHSTCKKYIDWKTEYNNKKEVEDKDKQVGYAIANHRYDSVTKCIKSKGRKRYCSGHS